MVCRFIWFVSGWLRPILLLLLGKHADGINLREVARYELAELPLWRAQVMSAVGKMAEARSISSRIRRRQQFHQSQIASAR